MNFIYWRSHSRKLVQSRFCLIKKVFAFADLIFIFYKCRISTHFHNCSQKWDFIIFNFVIFFLYNFTNWLLFFNSTIVDGTNIVYLIDYFNRFVVRFTNRSIRNSKIMKMRKLFTVNSASILFQPPLVLCEWWYNKQFNIAKQQQQNNISRTSRTLFLTSNKSSHAIVKQALATWIYVVRMCSLSIVHFACNIKLFHKISKWNEWIWFKICTFFVIIYGMFITFFYCCITFGPNNFDPFIYSRLMWISTWLDLITCSSDECTEFYRNKIIQVQMFKRNELTLFTE